MGWGCEGEGLGGCEGEGEGVRGRVAPFGQVRLVVDENDHCAARLDPSTQAALTDLVQVIDVAPAAKAEQLQGVVQV